MKNFHRELLHGVLPISIFKMLFMPLFLSFYKCYDQTSKMHYEKMTLIYLRIFHDYCPHISPHL